MQGSVSILNVSPEAAAMIASGGRISTMDGTAGEIYAKSLAAGQEKNEKLIGKVLSSGHTSVLEHCYVNLSFENVSVLAEQFLIEFRLASFTVKSGATSIFQGRVCFACFRGRRTAGGI
ncbi:MAG: FAD-dependent thymidylate synthase [Acutalibacteraceae bacterium]